MLTARQLQVLTVIDQHIRETGTSPTYAEMGEALGLTGRNTVYQTVNRLIERGFVRKVPLKARAIEVIRLPEEIIAAQVERIGTKIGGVQMDADGCGDNLAIALCSYFEDHPDRPAEDEGATSEDSVWSPWVLTQANRVLDQVARTAAEAISGRAA